MSGGPRVACFLCLSWFGVSVQAFDESDESAFHKARLTLWQRGLHEVPSCVGEEREVCELTVKRAAKFARALPVLRHRGGAELSDEGDGGVDLSALVAKLGPDFSAALALNEAEHARDCERSCANFYCAEPDARFEDAKIVATREISMGSVPPEDFAPAFRYPLDLIRVTKMPIVTAAEAAHVISIARSENVDSNVFTSGKYKLGGDWLLNLEKTRAWFNDLLRDSVYPNIAASFPEVVTNCSTLRAHSVALLKYNATHPRTDVHVDNGIIALTLALSSREKYTGGGTFFEHLGEDAIIEMDVGMATWRPGSVRHGGHRVTSGERYILGAFFLLSDRVEHVRRLKNRGSELRSKGDLEQAARHFKWALELNPRCTTCLKDLAEAYVTNDTLPEAERHLRAALDLLPRDSDALFSLGVVLSKRGDHSGALKAYRESAAVNSDDAELLYNLGLKLQQIHGSGVEERMMYQRALDVDPTFSKARCNLGASLAEAGDDDSAEPHLVTAAQDPAVAVTALQNLAVLYEHRAQRSLAGFHALTSRQAAIDASSRADIPLEKALDTWNRILHLAPPTDSVSKIAKGRLVNILKTRARLIAISDIPSAVTLLDRATQIAPTDAAAWQALEKASQLVGDSAKAANARKRLEALFTGSSRR